MRFKASSRPPALRVPWVWALGGALLGGLLTLGLFAPAHWLASAIHKSSNGQVQLIDAQGTVWTGSARLLLSGGVGSRGGAMLPGHIDWRLRPGWLSFNAQLAADCCTKVPLAGKLTWRWGKTGLQVTDGTSEWPAAVLAGLGTPWNTVHVEGVLQLVTRSLSVTWFEGRLASEGSAELTAMGVSSRLSPLKPMGTYRVTFTGGAAAALALATLEGPLQLSGSGRWVGSRLRFEGVASAAPEHEAALANLLNIIGRRNGARSIITLG